MCRNGKGTVVKYIVAEFAVSTLIYEMKTKNWKRFSRNIVKIGRIRVIVNRMIVKSLKSYVLSISSIIWK